jgi:NAD(P)-dependent dehydrogenase (short-subunit alcohol dehydrogenase family)
MANLDWRTQTVWITGAGSGLGAALTLAIARRGARVLATDIDAAGLARLTARADSERVRVVADACDVTDMAGLEAAVARAEATTSIDIAILNAGILIPQDALSFDANDFRRVFDVNVQGVVNSVAALLPHMIARRSGRLVFISSITAGQPAPGIAAYGASKAAISYLASALRLDVAAYGLKVQLVVPGLIDTPLLDRVEVVSKFRSHWLPPEQAADRIIRGVERGAREIRLPWGLTLAFGLMRALPSSLNDRVITALCRPPDRERP